VKPSIPKGNFYENKKFVEKKQNKIGGKRRFSAGAAVPPPLFHSSMLYLFKATAMPNLRAVTLFSVEFL
jgi:hypothetical protein